MYQIKQKKSHLSWSWLFCRGANPSSVVSAQVFLQPMHFEAVLPIFLTFISLTFGSDHKPKRCWEHHKSKSSWEKYQYLLGREWRHGSWTVPSCCVRWWLGLMQTCHWTSVGIHRGREIAMKQWTSSTRTDNTKD